MAWNGDLSTIRASLRSRVKRGRGVGEMATYRSWHGLREKPGKATFVVTPGIRTGRRHELRSMQAEIYLYLLERLNGMVDIREYLPILDVAETMQICAQLGIEHPHNEEDVEPFVLDFFYIRLDEDGFRCSARTLRTSQHAPAKGDVERMRVLQTWCERYNIEWLPVDTSSLTPSIQESLSFLRAWHRHRFEPTAAPIRRFAELFSKLYRRGATLETLVADISARTGLTLEDCENQFRYAGWAGFLDVNLSQPLARDKTVTLNASR